MNPVFIDEEIAACVAKVQTVLLTQLQAIDPNIQQIHFMHGHPLEIIGALRDMSKAPNKKALRYPLVALFRDFPEEKGITGLYNRATVQLFIITRTDPKYYSDERKEKSFKPILYPIKEELLRQMELSGKFMIPGYEMFKYTQIDHYFWGRESIYGADANIFTDWIDCIELKNLDLETYLKNC